jgi:hypothetical protein
MQNVLLREACSILFPTYVGDTVVPFINVLGILVIKIYHLIKNITMLQNHSVENSQSNPSFRVHDINKSKVKGAGDISSAFATFGNSVIKGLPEVYAQIKKDLMCNPEEFTASWLRLKSTLREEIKEIKELGHNAIPSVEISDLQNLSENDRYKILKRGAFLIKNVIPK